MKARDALPTSVPLKISPRLVSRALSMRIAVLAIWFNHLSILARLRWLMLVSIRRVASRNAMISGSVALPKAMHAPQMTSAAPSTAILTTRSDAKQAQLRFKRCIFLGLCGTSLSRTWS